MFYTKEELESLVRKDLQKLCKQFGIKANKKNCELVSDLVDYFDKLKEEEEKLKKELETKEWVSEDEEDKSNVNKSVTEDTSMSSEDTSMSSEQMKADLMKEVEKRANEKLTKIPRFCVDKVTIPSLMSPASQKIQNTQNKHFKKLDSLDVYLEKKRKRTAFQMNYHTKLKKQAEDNLKKMKMAHNTPKANPPLRKTRSSKENGTPATANKRKSFKIDKEVTFNFVSKLKTPKPIITSHNNTLKEKNIENKNVKFDGRKSVQFSKVQKRKSEVEKRKSALTAGDIKSPAMTFGTSPAPTKKTPAKFDLQASLKKRLSYKPHTGKLKGSYGNSNTLASTSFNANSTFTIPSQLSVKEVTKPKVTREGRRKDVTKRRDAKRTQQLSKRRGIAA